MRVAPRGQNGGNVPRSRAPAWANGKAVGDEAQTSHTLIIRQYSEGDPSFMRGKATRVTAYVELT